MRVAGMGCRAAAPPATLRQLLAEAGHLDLVAGPAARARQLQPAAADLGLRFLAVDEKDLRGMETVTLSSNIAARFGTGSVAEAAALIGAGRNARIMAPRRISDDATATIAIAEGDGP